MTLWKNQATTVSHSDAIPFEGAGLRPPGIEHGGIRHSANQELIEISAPTAIETSAEEPTE